MNAGGRTGSREPALGPGREFGAIRGWIGSGGPPGPFVLQGSGDDAAVLEGGWVVSTDLTVEDVHFRRAWLGWREVGWRAAIAGLSDLAAMAAEPVGILASVASPLPVGEDLDALQAGLREAAESVGAGVLGGDLTSSPGPLVVDVMALGRTDAPVLRVGALPGDELWVTGHLGAAAAAVRSWEEGGAPPATLRAAFARPRARVREARWLQDRAGGAEGRPGLRAMLDLSDGLAGDAGHLAAGNRCAVIVEAGRIPMHPEVIERLGEETARTLALHGGEDYELCFAASPGALDSTPFVDAFGAPLTRVGRFESGTGVWLEEGESRRRLDKGGFDHFAEVAAEGDTSP